MWLVAYLASSVNAKQHNLNLKYISRYSSINEINKFRKEDKQKVFVYFITKLPRMDGGTSYIGFNGGKTSLNSSMINTVCFSENLISKVSFIRAMEVSPH